MKKPLTAAVALLATGLLTACIATNANDGMQGKMMQGDKMQNCHKMMEKCHAMMKQNGMMKGDMMQDGMMKDGKMSPEMMKQCHAMMQDNDADDTQTSTAPVDQPVSAADHKKHHPQQ